MASTMNLSDAISEGSVIGGRYRVLSIIGEGGMGAVYRVEHVHIRKIFALKVLHATLGSQPENAMRFEREAVAAARIEHPNVVPATDFGRLPDGSFFLVLEFIDGRNLRSVIQKGPLRGPRVRSIMRGVLAGVRAAHEKGIVHRDLKPENIMLVERDGNRDFVKLLDFGIARIDLPGKSNQTGRQPLTVAGTVLGTPQYMSPEQVLGNPVDARSDLYSLGIILFELLTGSCPFVGNVPSILQQQIAVEAELPPTVIAANPGLAPIVSKLLAKRPEDRFQTARELAAALDQAPVQDETPRGGRKMDVVRKGGVAVGHFFGAVRRWGRQVPSSAANLAASTGNAVSGAAARVRDYWAQRRARRLRQREARIKTRQWVRPPAASKPFGRRSLGSTPFLRRPLAPMAKLGSSARLASARTMAFARRHLRVRRRTWLFVAIGIAALALAIIAWVARDRILPEHASALRPARTSGVDPRALGAGATTRAHPASTSTSSSSQPGSGTDTKKTGAPKPRRIEGVPD